MLTKAKILQIRQIINEHIGASIYLSTGVVPPGIDVAKLKANGIIASDVPESLISDTFIYSLLEAEAHGVSLATMSIAEIHSMILRHSMSGIERSAIGWLETNAALYCQGLGNRLEEKTMRIIHDAGKEAAMRGKIKDELIAGVENRKTRSQLVTDLRHATEDMSRDWHRIVNTELHNARTQGTVSSIQKIKGDDATLFVRPNPDCCDLCREAYLDGTGIPKVFKLSEISARDNVGRKTSELRTSPGLPCLHPHCACQVFYIDLETQEITPDGQIVFKKNLDES